MLATIRHNHQGMKSGRGGAQPEFRPVDLVVWTLEVERACLLFFLLPPDHIRRGVRASCGWETKEASGSQRHQRHGQANCLCNWGDSAKQGGWPRYASLNTTGPPSLDPKISFGVWIPTKSVNNRYSLNFYGYQTMANTPDGSKSRGGICTWRSGWPVLLELSTVPSSCPWPPIVEKVSMTARPRPDWAHPPASSSNLYMRAIFVSGFSTQYSSVPTK